MRFKKGKFYSILSMMIVICIAVVVVPMFSVKNDPADSDTNEPIEPPPVVDGDGNDEPQEETISFTNAYTAVNYAYDVAEKKGFNSSLKASLWALGDSFTFNVKGLRYNDVKNGEIGTQMIIKTAKSVPFIKADIDYRIMAKNDKVGMSDRHLMLDQSAYTTRQEIFSVENFLKENKMLPSYPFVEFDRSGTLVLPTMNRYPGYYKVTASVKPEALLNTIKFMTGMFTKYAPIDIVPKNINLVFCIRSNGSLMSLVIDADCSLIIDCSVIGMGKPSFSGGIKIEESYYSASTIQGMRLHDHFYNEFGEL